MASLGASMRWGDVQETPLSPSWSLFSNLVEFYAKQFRLSYRLNTSFSSVQISLTLLVFKVNEL